MIILPVADREKSRVEMVRSFDLVGRSRSPSHDEVAALACDITGAPSALVSLVGGEENWFAGVANYPDAQQCRWTSFCTHVVADPETLLWVEDARLDFRFADNRYVTEDPFLRFYAGAPIVVNGYAVGSLCVLDSHARSFDPVLADRLTRLARIVSDDMATRHQVRSLRHSLVASADALIDCDDKGIITEWSQGAERLFGFSSDEALGANVRIIVPTAQVADHDRGFEYWSRSGEARLDRRIELNAQRRDGTRIDIDLWMSVFHVDGVRHIHANIRDISERKRQAEELMSAKLEAEAANLAKSTFLANMSHELRTPLNGVIAVAELMSNTVLTDHQAELAAMITSSSDQLRRLIGDILDLARIESGELELVAGPVSLASMVDEVAALSSFAAHAKGLSLVSHIAPDANRMVWGDALRLKQVLTNLTSNAVKFTETGSVKVSVTRTGSRYRFMIADTGIGFNETQRALIFERFQQADGSITRRFGGTGLGLAISRELVAAMGGDLDCKGEAGRGAEFWFTVDLADAEEPAIVIKTVENSTASIGRALVVDDNLTNRRVAELLLNTAGIEVVSAEDGEQAVEAFLQGGFDVILMDMMMPVMDGIAATQAIRRIEGAQGLRRIPIVMLTANCLPDHVAASLDAGADVHLAKPISAEGLFQTLGRLEGEGAGSPGYDADASGRVGVQAM